MSIKNIIKKTFVYKYYAKKRSERYQKHLQEMSALLKSEGANTLNMFANALNHAGVQFWLDYGTLLGYQREHDFIGHDNDLDTGAFIEDADRVYEALCNNGFKLVRHYRTIDGEYLEHCYSRVGTDMTIDVFFYRRDINLVHGTCFSPKDEKININKNLFKDIPFKTILVTTPFTGLTKTSFKGADVYVPTNTDEYLKANYGDNYMIPDPTFSFKNAPNIKFLTYEEKPAVGYLEIPY